MNEYYAMSGDVWNHGLEDGEPDGIRVMQSWDQDSSVIIQIRCNGRVHNARCGPAVIAEIHRQYATLTQPPVSPSARVGGGV